MICPFLVLTVVWGLVLHFHCGFFLFISFVFSLVSSFRLSLNHLSSQLREAGLNSPRAFAALCSFSAPVFQTSGFRRTLYLNVPSFPPEAGPRKHILPPRGGTTSGNTPHSSFPSFTCFSACATSVSLECLRPSRLPSLERLKHRLRAYCSGGTLGAGGAGLMSNPSPQVPEGEASTSVCRVHYIQFLDHYLKLSMTF